MRVQKKRIGLAWATVWEGNPVMDEDCRWAVYLYDGNNEVASGKAKDFESAKAITLAILEAVQ